MTVTTFPTDRLDSPTSDEAVEGPVTSLDESELVRRAAARPGTAGRAEAREELARRVRRPAYTLAYQLLGDREDALDAAQDALVRFFETLERIEPGRPLRPWLFAIVRNRARDLHRRRRLRRTEPLTLSTPSTSTSRSTESETWDRPELRDPHPGPAADALRHELRRQVWSALASLPDEQREILVLRDYQDLSYRDIAAALGVPVGTVMSRLHRARRALRDRIRPSSPETSAATGGPS